MNSGTQVAYDSSLASAFQGSAEYQFIEGFDPSKANAPSPYESMNLHNALGYGKYGDGLTAAIIDGGFYLTEAGASSDHVDLNSKHVTAFGSFYPAAYVDDGCSGSNGNNSHGTCVAGVLAGDFADGGMHGVAFSARLHISSLLNTTGYADGYLHKAAATDDASTAVVQNNSWGQSWTMEYIDELSNTYGYNDNYLAGFKALFGSNIEHYIRAMNDFQDHGVIVFSSGNTSSDTSAKYTAGMPKYFPELAEAWIAVANIDVNGTSSYTYSNMGSPCGQAAAYCMAADGWNVTMPSVVISGQSYVSNASGTSFSAPMVSGAIVLMADHFPNQTPEQWTDRLLASANNNIGFTHVGHVEFGNGVKHSYSSEAGHGMLDIYAALQPIVSNSYTPLVAAGGGGGAVGGFYQLNETNLLAAASFGDAIAEALNGEVTFMYDALDGGFAFNLSDVVAPSLAISQPALTASSELGKTIQSGRLHDNLTRKKEGNSATDGFFQFSMNEGNRTLNDFASEGSWTSLNDIQYMLPFIADVQGGTGLSFGNSIGNNFASVSFARQNEDRQKGDVKQALTFSYGGQFSDNADFDLLFGFVDEQEDFLGTTGSGAFDFTGAENTTSFLAFKSTFIMEQGLILNVGAVLSYTDVNKLSSGIITGISGVTASAFELGVSKFGVSGGDALSFSVSQPHRVESGVAHLQIAGLKNSDGTIPYTFKDAPLAPTGRQIDLSLAYNFDLDAESAVRFKMIHTMEKRHVAEAAEENSFFLGYSTKTMFGDDQFAIGAAFTDAGQTSLDINYSIIW